MALYLWWRDCVDSLSWSCCATDTTTSIHIPGKYKTTPGKYTAPTGKYTTTPGKYKMTPGKYTAPTGIT